MTAPKLRRLPPAPLTAEQRALVGAPAALAMRRRLAARLASRCGRVVSQEDLEGAGALGLAEAARSFAPSFGVPFEVYAWSRVHGAMRTAVRRELAHGHGARMGGYRAVERARDEGDPWNDGASEHRAQLAELSDAFLAGMFLGLVGEASSASAVGAESEVATREAYARALATLARAVAELPEPDPRMLEMLYQEERSIEATGAALGMPFSTARRAHLKALTRLAARLRVAGVLGPPSRPRGL